ncbi:fumarylacetoacetate hydrolase family protein [Paraburkholderia sp. BL17N1]|uniref:fumarylacetoacetate hydrolase family protein n=1 Tax=Paraburkholderia sp. BL17N1 TaxID=1938798 RepID=UPI000F15C519|nr:fumarylacetoacetate hydrolase family protein [Paraburkholderia sp. BL17N1]RKR45160.1 2-keto-4-pentenoate hydratase/2-oxohepta-3-ene-1,7-dioic acid hydratase in catechol pathway [Paraburkholderia sp. BL17N1]
MKPYSLGTFSARDGVRFTGLVMNDRVASLAKLAAKHGDSMLAGATTVLALLENWGASQQALARLAAEVSPERSEWQDVADLRTHPAIDLPRQIFCTGANYRKHVVDLTVDSKVGPEGMDEAQLRQWAENMLDERVAHGEPYAFTKPVSAVSGAFDPLVLPDTTTQPDWELELAVVIGRGGYRISRDDALDHVAGYTIVNDISARDLIPRTDYKMLGTDWLRSKGQPGFLPLGPYFVPGAFVPDPHRLKMRLTVSGRVMQDETTADMLFGIERQIEYISRYTRLLPGDIICTGSPAGNGTHYNRFLREGDVMEAEIEGLGRQRQVCTRGGND